MVTCRQRTDRPTRRSQRLIFGMMAAGSYEKVIYRYVYRRTISTASFLWSFEPGLLTSRRMCVQPALYPMKAVKCGAFDVSSTGKAFTRPNHIQHHTNSTQQHQRAAVQSAWRPYHTAVTGGAFARQEPHGTVARCLIFTVRHLYSGK